MTTTTYLINHLQTQILGYQSPYSKLLNISLNYHKLKCFGCLYFPWIKPYASHKLVPKSTLYVFVGYSVDQHVYVCLDLKTRRICTSRHVKFVESEFPFNSLVTHANPSAEQQTGPLQLSILQPINQPTVSTTLNPPEDSFVALFIPSITHFPVPTQSSNETRNPTQSSPKTLQSSLQLPAPPS